MRIFMTSCLSILLSAAAIADSRVDFSVEAHRSGKLNSRNMVVEFESITVTEASGDAAYLDPGTEFTALDFQRSWPENFAVGTGGTNWPGGGFGQFGAIDFAYVSRESLTVKMDGLWIYPIGHERDESPSFAVLTLVLYADQSVEMWVDIGD